MTLQKEPWIDTRLNQEEMNFLHKAILDENRKDTINSTSVFIQDKDNWFYNNVLKEISEYMYFKSSWPEYFDVNVVKSKAPPVFDLTRLWVNHQKQHEFNPPHQHQANYSFVVFMKIPTHWKEQHSLPLSVNSNHPCASDFQFLVGGPGPQVKTTEIPLCPEDEGRMLFFPAWLSHQVFPFYECKEERITISGNIVYNELEKNDETEKNS